MTTTMMTGPRRRRLLRAAALGAVALFGAIAAGCNIVAPIAYIIEGPPSISAVWKLDSGRKTVLFIDDRSTKIPKRSIRFGFAEAAEATMLSKGIVREGDLISYRSAARVVAGESSEDLMTVVDIGRAVGAEVVVYLEVTEFTIATEPPSLSPLASGTVEIFDAVKNERIPTRAGEDLHPWSASPPRQSDTLPPSRVEREQAYDAFAAYAGVRLAQLFYKHPANEALADFRP